MDDTSAQVEVNRLYAEFVASKKLELQKKLPSIPPERILVQHYYDCLEKAVEDRLRKYERNAGAENTVVGSVHMLHSDTHTVTASTEGASR